MGRMPVQRLFYVVTPSFNQLTWLQRCLASVRDQCDGGHIRVHHHVQDACSKDGTLEYLKAYVANLRAKGGADSAVYSFSFASEKDGGMYDAINRGWRLAPPDTDFVSHLNCDEQYLPNALARVADFMAARPQSDVVLADMIVVDREGAYICHRRSLTPYRLLSRFCCAGFTATTFQRISVTREKGVFFDAAWKNFGDKVWYNALHRADVKFAICNEVVALFTDTGENLNWTVQGLREKQAYNKKYQWGLNIGSVLAGRLNGLRRAIKEWPLSPPQSYDLIAQETLARERREISRPTGLWHKQWNQVRY